MPVCRLRCWILSRKIAPDEEKAGLKLKDKAVRNQIVNQGLERAQKSKPASFFSSDRYSLVKTGNLEDDFEAISEADWVIEVIVENLKIKQDLMARIDEVRKPRAIVSSNTSGFRSRILPRVAPMDSSSISWERIFSTRRVILKLLEIIPTAETLPDVTEFIS